MAKKFVMKQGTFSRLLNSRGIEGVTCKTCDKTIEVGQEYYVTNKNGSTRHHEECYESLFLDIPDEESPELHEESQGGEPSESKRGCC